MKRVKHEENWGVYMRPIAAGDVEIPQVVFVDLGWMSETNAALLPRVVRVTQSVEEVSEQGLPTAEEMDELQAGEERIIELIEAAGGVFVGALTNGDGRESVCYVPARSSLDAETVRKALHATNKRIGPGSIVVEDDPEWTYYAGTLFPTPREHRVMMDDLVLRQLAEAGDSSSAERRVDHWLYFPTRESRDSFVVWSEANGYEIESLIRPGELEQEQFGVNIFAMSNIEPQTIHSRIAALCAAAEEHGGEYDGWETFVMKESGGE